MHTLARKQTSELEHPGETITKEVTRAKAGNSPASVMRLDIWISFHRPRRPYTSILQLLPLFLAPHAIVPGQAQSFREGHQRKEHQAQQGGHGDAGKHPVRTKRVRSA